MLIELLVTYHSYRLRIAILFSFLKFKKFYLCDKTPHGIKVEFTGFPYIGIWAAKDADFVCIEPWYGIADSVNTSGNLEDKEGTNVLEIEGRFEAAYGIEVF